MSDITPLKTGAELGRKDRYRRYQKQRCPQCGKERWVRAGRPLSICRECTRKLKALSWSREASLLTPQQLIGVCRWAYAIGQLDEATVNAEARFWVRALLNIVTKGEDDAQPR